MIASVQVRGPHAGMSGAASASPPTYVDRAESDNLLRTQHSNCYIQANEAAVADAIEKVGKVSIGETFVIRHIETIVRCPDLSL